jgi:ribosome modulation factor
MKKAMIAVLAGAMTLGYAPMVILAQGPPPAGWEVPPSQYREVQQQGYRDGIEGARKDYQNHRRPDVENRDEYRHPHVPDPDKAAYRDAFRAGYQAGVQHIMNGH